MFDCCISSTQIHLTWSNREQLPIHANATVRVQLNNNSCEMLLQNNNYHFNPQSQKSETPANRKSIDLLPSWLFNVEINLCLALCQDERTLGLLLLVTTLGSGIEDLIWD